MENFISPLRFKKSNYVIRLFSNKASVIKLGVNLRNIFTISFCYIKLKNGFYEKYHFFRKCEKIKKDSKIHNAKTNDRRDFWLAPFEREKLALS